MVEFFKIVIMSAVFAALACMFLAEKRGRSPILGLAAGLLFSWLAVLYYLLVGDTTELRVKKEIEIRKQLES